MVVHHRCGGIKFLLINLHKSKVIPIFATEKLITMNDLTWGLILVAILVSAVNYIITHSEENKRQQDEAWDKAWREYQEFRQKHTNYDANS